MGAAAQVIGRDLVLDRLDGARVGVVIAPGGFGKSTVASMLAERSAAVPVRVDVEVAAGRDVLVGAVAGALTTAGVADLAEAVGLSAIDASADSLVAALRARDEPVLMIVDDIHRLDDGAARWLGEIAAAMPAPHSIVLLGRDAPRGLEDSLRSSSGGIARVGEQELRFDATDVARYLAQSVDGSGSRTRVDPDALFALTKGWPAAVALATSRWAGRPPHRLSKASGSTLIAALVDDLLAPSTPEQRATIAALAQLPLLTVELAEAVAGESALDTLVSSGLPLNRRIDGWIEIPDPIREAIGSTPLTAQQVAAATGFYADLGDLGLATSMLIDDATKDAFAEVLAGRSWLELDEFGLASLRATLGVLGEQRLQAHPALLIAASWVAESRDPEMRRHWIELADRACGPGHPLRARVLAEWAKETARTGDLDRAEVIAQETLASCADGCDAIARARALTALGYLNSIRASPTANAAAAAQLEEALLLLRLVRERRWEADALLRLGYAVNFSDGRSEIAAEQIAQSLAIAGAANRQRAIMLTYYADVLDNLGRVSEAEAAVNEAIAIGRRLGDPMLVWYGAWSMMQITAHRQDLEATRRWIAEAERHLGPWEDDPKGIEFRLFVVDVLCILGDEKGATAAYEAVALRAAEFGLEDAFHVVVGQFEATFGDPVRAEEMLARLDGATYAVDRSRWTRRMLRALAAHRRGDAATARRFLEESLAEAAAIGAADLPERHEGRMVRILAQYMPETRDVPAEVARIRMLGAFCVEAGGDDVTPQPGHPATLVKLLALRGSMMADQLFDLLWPDADVTTGRARLRNLLNRLRTRSGDIVARQGEALQLRAGVDLDVQTFETLARRAFDAPPSDRAGAARLAVAAYGGDLLPGDRYEDWAAAPRERLRRLFVGLTDVLADDALARGDVDEAVRQLSAAIDADPLDDSRPVRAADLLLAKGARVAARRMVERAVSTTSDLGLPIAGRLGELQTLLLT